jgi:hypothetical protein
MATENQLESSQPGEQGDLPTPEFSESGASSTSSGADEIVSKLLPQLEQIIERKVQSTKDKRFSELEKVLGGRSKILAELESEGVTIPKEVRTQMQIRELEERLAGQSTQPAPVVDNGLSTQKAAVTEAIAELKKYELDANDAGFIELLRGKYANRAEFDLKVSRYVVGKLAPQKPANPADVVQPPARAGAQGSADVGDLQAELIKLAKSPSAPGAMQRMAEIKKQLTEAGV